MKPVRIAQTASEEFTEAVRWYEGKRTGLGGEFYETDDLYIIAIAHVSRRPGYWKQRT